MHGIVPRKLFVTLISKLSFMPVVTILGPRQCGKSTLAAMFAENKKNIIRLDLERPADLKKLEDPEAFFKANNDMTICIDEIQRKPNLFPVLRYITDERNRPGQFLIIGSASKELIRQSSETLAGRISYLERGFRISIGDLNISRAWIIAPIEDLYKNKNVYISALEIFLKHPDNQDIFY